jgi:tetratricopeptide (TPR) repeat protein
MSEPRRSPGQDRWLSYGTPQALFRDPGYLLGQAEALNRLGELATRTADTPQAREYHAQALAIARDLGAAPEEARALEGLGQAHLQDGSRGQGTAHLRRALTIYKRIGAPAARRVRRTIRNYHLAATTTPGPQPAAPAAKATSSHPAAPPQEAVEHPMVQATQSAGTTAISPSLRDTSRQARSNCESA